MLQDPRASPQLSSPLRLFRPPPKLHPERMTERPNVSHFAPFNNIPERAKEGTRCKLPSATHLDAASTQKRATKRPSVSHLPPLTDHSGGSDGASLRSHLESFNKTRPKLPNAPWLDDSTRVRFYNSSPLRVSRPPPTHHSEASDGAPSVFTLRPFRQTFRRERTKERDPNSPARPT